MTARIGIGAFSVLAEHWGRPPASHLDLIAVAQRADRLGFHSLGLPYVPLLSADATTSARFGGVGSFAHPYHLDAHALVPVLLHETARIKVGFQVLLAPVLHPFIWAKYLASLEVMSGGRVLAGFGIGVARPAGVPGAKVAGLDKLGLATRTRGRAADEALEVMTRLWTSEEPFTFEGEHVIARDVAIEPRGLRPGGPELWWAGQSPRGYVRAARFADVLELEWPAVDFVRDVAVPGLAEANAAHGGHATIAALVSAEVLDRTPDPAYVKRRFGRYHPDSVIVGTPAECAAKLRRLADAGVAQVNLNLNRQGGDPLERLHEQLERWAHEVVPLLA